MIEFLPKSAIFFELSWLLMAIAVSAVGYFQHRKLRLIDPSHNYSESLVVLLILLITVSVVFGMSSLSHGVFLTAWASLGLVLHLLYRQTPVATPQIRATTRHSVIFIWLACLLIIGYTSTQVHYDYFHGTYPSIDLAIHGQSPSKWLSDFDPTYWPVLVQTTLPVLDAVEIYYTDGILTNSLPLLFAVLLTASTLIRLDAPPVTQLAITFILGVYILDFAFSPRSHILIGLACSLMVLAKKPLSLTFATAAAALILAKRDGIIILSILLLCFSLCHLVTTYKHKLNTTKILIGATACTALITLALPLTDKWIIIGGLSLNDAALSILSPSTLAVFIKKEILIAISLVALALFTVKLDKHLLRQPLPLLIVVSICIYVCLSALMLQGLDRYNQGTIERKLSYMLLPAAAIFFASRIEAYKRAIT